MFLFAKYKKKKQEKKHKNCEQHDLNYKHGRFYSFKKTSPVLIK